MPLVLAVLALFAAPAPLAAVSLFQTEDFESGSSPWGVPPIHPTPPIILGNLGPEGGGDAAMIASSSGGANNLDPNPGSRLAILATSVWTGDFSAAGVSGLRVDLRNTGSTLLSMRFGMNGPGGWFVTDAAIIPAGSGWETHSFDLSPGTLTASNESASPDLGATLANVTQLRLFHQLAPDNHRGTPVPATIRIDNITAIPEPGAAAFGAASLASLLRRRRARRTTLPQATLEHPATIPRQP